MSIYLGLQNSTPQEIQYLYGLGQEATASLQEVGLESSSTIGDSNTIGLLGLINPTSSILSCSANTVNATLLQSRRVPINNVQTDNILTHSEYINLMNYSFYSIAPKIKALGLILDGLYQFTGTSSKLFSTTDCENWTELDTTTSYISNLSNINQIIKGQTYKSLLTTSTTTTGFGIYIKPCFILSNKKILIWHNVLMNATVYASYYWNCLLQYFNFRGGLKETFSFSGSNGNGFDFSPIFNAVSPDTMSGTQSFEDIFEQNIDNSLSLRLGIIYGWWQVEKLTNNLIKIDNSQRTLPFVFINNIPGTSNDLSFKIDGLYKYWYTPGDNWTQFINKPRTHNIGSHIVEATNGNVSYKDASLRDSTITSHQLYIKNSDGTFTAVKNTDLIDSSLYYTTYSS